VFAGRIGIGPQAVARQRRLSRLPTIAPFMPAISFQHVVKTYRGARGAVQALDDVSFDIEPGEFFGLLGPNGAGKTTLISILAGLARATSGNVKVLGHDVVSDYAAARRSLGIVPQELVFDPFFSVREALRIQSGYFGVRRDKRANDAWIDELLAHLGLADKADANMRQLSGGMKRRVLVAQALVHRPPVIVLDEPTAGVDVELRQTLWQFIARLNKEGHTVLLTTHYLEEAEALCGRLAMLKQGRVVALDRTSALLAGTASTMLRFKMDAPLPASLAGQSRVTGRIVQITAHDAVEVETILGTLRQAGCVPEDLEIGRADLEDVFLEIRNGPARAPVLAGAAA
jgi:ABC-2 type transport system ATP-binding protein